MRTTTPANETADMLMVQSEDIMSRSIEVPLQQMFDEFMVFISKADFE